MTTALRALTLAFAVILFSTAAYASAQQSGGGSAQPPSATAPSTPPGGAPMSNAVGKHNGPCKADVQNFCSSVQKGGGRVLACLKEHKGQLSASCEAAMQRHAAMDAAQGQKGVAPASGAPTAPSNSAPPTK